MQVNNEIFELFIEENIEFVLFSMVQTLYWSTAFNAKSIDNSDKLAGSTQFANNKLSSKIGTFGRLSGTIKKKNKWYFKTVFDHKYSSRNWRLLDSQLSPWKLDPLGSMLISKFYVSLIKGPSINYVVSKSEIFDPLPPS